MDPEPIQIFDNIVYIQPIDSAIILSFGVIAILLFCSAIISATEVAYFSLSQKQIQKLKNQDSQKSKLALKHLEKPQLLLSNILVANIFVNIAVVVVSSSILSKIFDFQEAKTFGIIFQVAIITFLILLFGEILPKILANSFTERFTKFMAYPMFVISKICNPISKFLIRSSSVLTQKFSKKTLSMEDVSDALDIASENIEDEEEKEFLEGIVKLNRIDVTNIMQPRVDATAVEISVDFKELLSFVVEKEFSRIPVYEETFDQIKGVLYVKDLLPNLDKPASFRWQALIRPAYFIPESKKIDDLLEEFQKTKVHLALVVDEYGGISGIVTLEDILEEILGEINDEFDDVEELYTKIDDETYIFEGKCPLNDFYKVLDLDDDIFESEKGDADTLAGLILEIKGDFPKLFEKITLQNFTFRIEAEDKRRIMKIKVFVGKKEEDEDN